MERVDSNCEPYNDEGRLQDIWAARYKSFSDKFSNRTLDHKDWDRWRQPVTNWRSSAISYTWPSTSLRVLADYNLVYSFSRF